MIKYVYLGDLAYAEKHGVSYTQSPWKFHKFGPWSLDVFSRITPALQGVGAEKQSYSSKYEEDTVRWILPHAYQIHDLESKIDIDPRSAIKKSVHQFGSDTESLLSHVYLTQPLLTVAPGESLNFQQVKTQLKTKDETVKSLRNLSIKENNITTQLKQQIQTKLAQKKSQQPLMTSSIVPRYDALFFQGQEWLDSLEGTPILPVKGEATFSADIWKSKARFDPDVS